MSASATKTARPVLTPPLTGSRIALAIRWGVWAAELTPHGFARANPAPPQGGSYRPRSLLVVVLIAALFFSAPAFAGVQPLRVLGVGVSRSSQQAQAMAVDYAKKRAVYLFARKLQVENASAKVAALKPEEMKRIVRGATILNIRREKEITYADVSVSIVDTELRRALDLPAATAGTLGDTVSASRSVLILPVYRTQERAYLWETENPLRELLRLEVLRQAHGAVLVPAGDFEDLRLIDHNNAAVVTGVELGSMFERYGAEEIIIATATPGAEGTIEPTSITLRRLTPKDVRVEVMKVPVVEVKETAATRLQMAAAAIASAVTQIATSTSYDERRALENASHLKVYFTYANPRELGKMQQSIRGAANVMALEIPNITLQNVSGTIYYSGERQTLKIDLAKQGIVVGERSDGWMLSLR